MAIDIRPAGHSDIPDIVQLQALVWQDHFFKERNTRVPMMMRSVRNMEYYMESGGTFLAEDRGRIVGSIISHVWGSVGWFGPLEVNPVCQGRGIGKALVGASLEFLRSEGCSIMGCETMAGSARNIAFYNKLGFRTRGISNVLFKRLGQGGERAPGQMGGFVEWKGADSGRALWEQSWPGLDYGPELERTNRLRLGKVWALDTEQGRAHAVVHTYEMFEGSQNAILKLLVAGKGDYAAASALLARCEETAVEEGKTGMFIRTYDPTPPGLGWFFERGYELQGTSVRLLKEGRDEADGPIHVSCWSG